MPQVMAWLYVLLILFAICGFIVAIFGWMGDHNNRYPLPLLIAALTALGLAILALPAHAHNASRPELNAWFDHLASGKGPCCSNADGTAVVDADWESKGGRYRVRIEGEWWDVPDNAVIKEPNRDGRTIVWPIYYRSAGAPDRIEIRCFMPGSMT
jgi:hypothetical protein